MACRGGVVVETTPQHCAWHGMAWLTVVLCVLSVLSCPVWLSLQSIAPQGALDGGLNIPHNEKRFVGWTKEEGLEAEVRGVGVFWGGPAATNNNSQQQCTWGVGGRRPCACIGQTVHLLLPGSHKCRQSAPIIDSSPVVLLPGPHYDAVQVLKKYIYGGHVAEYMEEMEEEDPEKYNRWVGWHKSVCGGGGGEHAHLCVCTHTLWLVCGRLCVWWACVVFVTPS